MSSMSRCRKLRGAALVSLGVVLFGIPDLADAGGPKPIWVKPTRTEYQKAIDALRTGDAPRSPKVPGGMKIVLDLLKNNGGDHARVIRDLKKMRYEGRVEEVCLSSIRMGVGCTNVDEWLRDVSDPAERNLLRMCLDDFAELSGFPDADIISLCEGASPSRISDMVGISSADAGIAIAPPGLSVGGLSIPGSRGNKRSPSTSGSPTVEAFRALGEGAAKGIADACGGAQAADIRSRLNSPAPGDPQYQQAVNYAVSAMDQAVADCRDSGSSGIASGEGAGKPGESEGSKKKDEETKQARMSMGDALTFVAESSVAIGQLGFGVAEAANASTSSVKAAAALAVEAGLAAAGAAGDLSTDPTVEAVGDAAEGVEAIVTLVEVVGGGTAESAAAATALTGSTAAGAGVWALAAYGSYKAGMMSGEGYRQMGEVSAKMLSDTYASVNDAIREWQYPTGWKAPSGAGTGVQKTAEPGTATRCESVGARWEAFKESCEESDWRTYDCAIFVARMNGCADPALIDPGPEGDYVCHAKGKDSFDRCAHYERIVGMLGVTNPEGRGRCHSTVARTEQAAQQAMIERALCQQGQPSPDGTDHCAGASPRRSDAGKVGGNSPKPKGR